MSKIDHVLHIFTSFHVCIHLTSVCLQFLLKKTTQAKSKFYKRYTGKAEVLFQLYCSALEIVLQYLDSVEIYIWGPAPAQFVFLSLSDTSQFPVWSLSLYSVSCSSSFLSLIYSPLMIISSLYGFPLAVSDALSILIFIPPYLPPAQSSAFYFWKSKREIIWNSSSEIIFYLKCRFWCFIEVLGTKATLYCSYRMQKH